MNICKRGGYNKYGNKRKKYMDTSNNKNSRYMLEKDIWATNVYTIGYEYDSWSNLDYTKKIRT